MDTSGIHIANLSQSEGPFDPTYLNLEFFFNQVFSFLAYLKNSILDLSGGTFFLPQIKIILSVSSIFFITVIIYALVRIREIRMEEEAQLHFSEPAPKNGAEAAEQWEVVQQHINTDNPSDWRLAILEADMMLDHMVKKMGYEGESLGERLKAIDPSDIGGIQSAWEAHKVRNQIAHEGTGFRLDKREARRIIGLYEKVFKEFGYI